MRKFKKFLAAAMTGAIMLGLTTAAMPTANLYAAPTPTKSTVSASNEIFAKARITADPPTGPSVTVSGAAISVDIDYENFTATLTSNSNDIFAFVDVYKGSKDNTVDYTKKPSSSSSYKFKGNTVTIDLSFLKVKSVQGIEVYGDKSMTARTRKELVTQPAKLKSLKYDSTNKKFTYKDGSNTVDLPVAGYEYRGGYASEWKPLSEFADTEHISAAKTEIYIRACADKDSALAGVETKVSIDKAPNAPKVTIDYVKGQIDLKKGTEVSLDGTFNDKTEDVNKLTGKVTLEDIRNAFNKDGQTDFTVFVRTKEGKKPASSIVPVAIPAVTKLVPGTTTLISGSAIVVSDAIDSTQKVTATFDAGTGKNPKPVYIFKAEGANFEYQIGDTTDKWVTIKKEQSIKVTLGDGIQTLKIRKCGTTVKKGGSDAFPSEAEIITISAK